MSKEGVSINSIKEISATFPGFRFSPTDAELISYYLKRKIDGADLSRDVITEVEICKFEPWDLPAQSIIHSDHEWFFFSPNDKKYPNGSQAKRATRVGFWKATGKERDIKSEKNVIGTKRTLVFHIGRSPKGTRTDWIMHEYCLKENKDDKSQDSYVICRLRKNQNFTTTSSSGEAGSQPSLSPEDSTLHATPIVCNDLQHIQIGVCREGKDDTVRSIEDDWFADVMKDDIVNLDYGQFYEDPLLPNVAECSAVQESSPAACSSESGVRHIAAPRDIRPGRDGDRRNVENMPRVGDKDLMDEHPEVEVVKGHGNGNCVLIYLAKSKNSLLMANGWRLSTIFVVLAVVVYFFVPVL